MEKSHFTLITFMIASCLLWSCKVSKTQASNETSDSLVTHTEETQADTLTVNTDSCKLEEGENLYSLIRVDYPTGTSDLATNVRKILNQKLADAYLGANNEEGAPAYKPYAGDLSDAKTVIGEYCKANFNYLKTQMDDIKKYDSRATVNMNYELNISKKTETDKYITYQTFSYAYLAGAHGSSFEHSFNIVKPTGKLLAQTLDTTLVKKLQPILRKGVISYLNEYNKEDPVTDKTLNGYLFIENGIIPLPAYAPYLAEDGLHFAYQQYEIGPYAMGIVTFTVPYADIKPYMTQEALQLVK